MEDSKEEKNKPAEEKPEGNLVRLLEFFGSEMRYYHSVMWEGERFFTGAIAAFFAGSLTLLGLQFGAAAEVRSGISLALVLLGILFSFAGRAVLVTESSSFLRDACVVEEIGLILADEKSDASEVKSALASILDQRYRRKGEIEKRVKENVEANRGIRFVFRVLYLLYACGGLVLYAIIGYSGYLAGKPIWSDASAISIALSVVGLGIFILLAILFYFRRDISGLLSRARRALIRGGRADSKT